MHVMRDTEAWLSWLEHTVHIREVTGSSPVASTTLYQSAPVADWFFIFLNFLCKISMILLFWGENTNFHILKNAKSNLNARKSFNSFILIAPSFTLPFGVAV